MEFDSVRAIQWQQDKLLLLDQRLLPHVEQTISCTTINDVTQSIRDMVVRGAPAIGITAAFGVALACRDAFQEAGDQWREHVQEDLHALLQARPTAINLAWAVNEMQQLMLQCQGDPFPVLLNRAQQMLDEDIQANRRMGQYGAGLIEQGSSVLTHCNTGSLATGGFGTALGVIRTAYQQGLLEKVYADETRPWLQGSRLTSWELQQDNIPCILVVDGAAPFLLKQGDVKWVIVGADRIAANGDVANKIGTYAAAIAARHHGVRFMVVAPTSTIDMNVDKGDQIPIEHRDALEILELGGAQIAAQGSYGWNPVFDITPADLIDAIVTEKGVIQAPDSEKMRKYMGKKAD